MYLRLVYKGEIIMTKEVLVSICGLQLAPEESQEDSVELIAPGEYYYKNEKHYVLYEEVSEDTSEVTRNVVKIKPGYMEVTKKGPSTVHMVFEAGKKTVTYYYTPFGGLHIGIDTKSVTVDETEDKISIKAAYDLEINYECVGNCNITIEVNSKEAKDFKLI